MRHAARGLRLAPLVLALLFGPARAAASDGEAVRDLFELSCTSCHGERKQKGDLRLDRADGIASVVVAGDAAKSELYRRITLPLDHDDVMPPYDDPVTEAEQAAVLEWIRAGASMDVFEATGGDRARALAEAEARIEAVREASGAQIVLLDGDSTGALRVDFAFLDEAPTPEAVAAIEPLADRVVELSFAGQAIGLDQLSALPDLPALERAHLERTAVDDAAVEAIARRAPGLRYLNVHSTRVTERTLERARSLQSLERLVLFGTAVAPAEVTAFHAERPTVHATTTSALPSTPFPNGGPRRIVVADAGKERVAMFRETAIGSLELLWEHPVALCPDLQGLQNGNVLLIESRSRIVEVDPRSGETVWTWESESEHARITSLQRQADGVTSVVGSGLGMVAEIDPDGELLNVVEVSISLLGGPATLHARRTGGGGYLVAHGAQCVYDYGRQRSFGVRDEDLPESLRGRSGSRYLSTRVLLAEEVLNGGGDRYLLLAPDGVLVEATWSTPSGGSPDYGTTWRFRSDEAPGMRLGQFLDLQQLGGGRVVIANAYPVPEIPQSSIADRSGLIYVGDLPMSAVPDANAPLLVEVNRDKEVVWRLYPSEQVAGPITAFWIYED